LVVYGENRKENFAMTVPQRLPPRRQVEEDPMHPDQLHQVATLQRRQTLRRAERARRVRWTRVDGSVVRR
jgi:hypothetical protein